MSPGSIGPSRRESASRVRAVFPAVYPLREFAEAAGLVAYSTNFGDLFREAAGYIAVGVNLPKRALSAAAIRSHSSAGTEVARLQSKRPSLVRRGFNACQASF